MHLEVLPFECDSHCQMLCASKKPLSVESLSCVWLCDPMDCSMPAFPVHQNSQSSLKLMSSSLWCHPTISYSVAPFSSCLQSFPASRSFQMSQLSTCLGFILDTPTQLILAWENPWTEKGAWWPTDHGVAEELDTTEQLNINKPWLTERESEAAQSRPTLCHPGDCTILPVSSIHGIFQSKSVGVGSRSLLQRIFPTWGSNPGLPRCRQPLSRLRHQGSSALREMAWPARSVFIPSSLSLPDTTPAGFAARDTAPQPPALRERPRVPCESAPGCLPLPPTGSADSGPPGLRRRTGDLRRPPGVKASREARSSRNPT